MQRSGWIRRGEKPEQSRFWQLLTGDKARMFGVFNRFELQVLRDWICDGNTAGMQPPRLAAVHRGMREDLCGDTYRLRRAAARSNDVGATMTRLLPWLAPDRHHSAAGLYATRLFSQLLG